MDQQAEIQALKITILCLAKVTGKESELADWLQQASTNQSMPMGTSESLKGLVSQLRNSSNTGASVANLFLSSN